MCFVLFGCSIKQHLLELLGSDGLLAIPSAPGPAFLNEGVDAAAFQQLRMASLSLTCIAGLGGLPQVGGTGDAACLQASKVRWRMGCVC